MLFGLKNIRATFQRMINKVFAQKIDRNVEAYINDVVMKSDKFNDYRKDLKEVFNVLK